MKKRSINKPLIVAFSLGYFILSILWLVIVQKMDIVTAGLAALVFYVLMTGMLVLALSLRRTEAEPQSPLAKLFFGQPSDKEDEAILQVDQPSDEEDETGLQDKVRREAWIKAHQREDQKVHDRMFRLGASIGIGLVIYAAIMYVSFGLFPDEVFMMSIPAIAALWLIQIVFFPKWLTYTSFLVFAVLRFGIETFGPQILVYLPNFLMLPVFYLLMMFFMFGSIMLPNLAQQKFNRPGQGNWERRKGSTRGQFVANATVDTQMDRFERYAKKESDRKPTRGMIFKGPPGTGKTLKAQEIATTTGLPFAYADASAFNAPFMGFGQLIPLVFRFRVEALAKEYGGAIVFIDEGENLFGARSGMQQQNQFSRELDLWDVMPYENGDQVFDVPHVRTRQWNEQYLSATPMPPEAGTHNIFMMPGAGGGNNSGIYPFLTWMSGTDSPPFMQKLIRGKINTLASALFFPVRLFHSDRLVLRLPPGKPRESTVMFITATNRFWMFDPAMIRPGRFGIVVDFVIPDEDERTDIFKYYVRKWAKYYQEDLLQPDRWREFAQATPNTSPAEIEQMVEEAIDVRVQHLAELRRVKALADAHKLDKDQKPTAENELRLYERDRKFWLRFKDNVYDAAGREIAGWDDERVDWHALMETQSSISHGRAVSETPNETTRRNVAIHELGHYLALKMFNGRRLKATVLSVISRSGSLGRVGFVPYDTREQFPQEFYEGLIRTSVASWVAEHFFFGQNMPGVTGDLRNATSTACLLVGKFGMSSYNCPKEDEDYYAQIGDVLISEPETTMFNPQATALLESVLRNPAKRKTVAIIIGMAAVDAYRLIRANQALFESIIPEFLEIDEFQGNKLRALSERLDAEMVTLEQLNEGDRQAKPELAFAVLNPFYGAKPAEGANTFARIAARVEEMQS